MFRLDGKVALVTGSNRGMGAAMALGFARAGANVVLHDIAPPEETAKRIREETSVRTHCLAADLSSRAQADRLIGEAVAAMGAVDILVNNAGIIRRAPAVEHGDEDWDAVIEINLTAVFRLCRAAGAHMLPRGRGKIVNIASLLAFQGGINVPSYAAAKGGVAQITKALANEWAGRGVNVNAIAPGYMRTENTRPLFQNEERRQAILERIPAGRWGEPEDVCGAAVFLASAAADYVHGHVLVVDGGWMAR
ncbi:MAG: 2-dehydro-3-deoxy-D-gluconate 5-dehydrogenase KduD [Bryobacteraceae bacterium]|jgi:2-deoxy-D-gluconate 3-dehydrogenase